MILWNGLLASPSWLFERKRSQNKIELSIKLEQGGDKCKIKAKPRLSPSINQFKSEIIYYIYWINHNRSRKGYNAINNQVSDCVNYY